MQKHIETAERFGRALDHVVDHPAVANVALHPRHLGLAGRSRPVVRRDDGRARLA
jgi:hypothetical protein